MRNKLRPLVIQAAALMVLALQASMSRAARSDASQADPAAAQAAHLAPEAGRTASSAAGGASKAPPVAAAGPSHPATQADLDRLQREIDAEARKLRELEQALAREEKAVQHPAQPAPIGAVNPNRLTLGSSESGNLVRLGALVEADGRYFADSSTPASANGWLLRRVRPILEGTLDHIFDFRIMPDFGGGKAVVDDAYVAARLSAYAAITVGKMKMPVGLEILQSPADLRFIERGLPSDLVPNRDVGLQIAGSLAAGRIGYALGYFNGVVDETSSDSNPKPDESSTGHGDWAARLFFEPFVTDPSAVLHGLGFGIAGSYSRFTGSAADPLLPSYRTVGQQALFSYRGNTAATSAAPALQDTTYAHGERLRWTPQLYDSLGSVGLLAEYAHVSQGVARSVGGVTRTALLVQEGWQVQLSWFITGERESYRGFTPRTTFALGRPGWGAFELVARVGELSVDPRAFAGGSDSFANPATSARAARDAGIGLNWYLTSNLKWSLDYDRTHFSTAPNVHRDDEQALFAQFQISF